MFPYSQHKYGLINMYIYQHDSFQKMLIYIFQSVSEKRTTSFGSCLLLLLAFYPYIGNYVLNMIYINMIYINIIYIYIYIYIYMYNVYIYDYSDSL